MNPLDQSAKNLATFEEGLETPPGAMEDPLPPPTRSPSDASHHSRKHANPKIHQTLKRTKTISAHILNNGTRPLVNAQRAVVNQFTNIGREVLRPMLTTRHPVDPAVPEPPSMSEASSPDQSSAESEEERSPEDSSAASAIDSASPSESDVSLPSEEKRVGSPEGRSPIFVLRRTIAMTFSIPSTLERTNRTPTAKGGVRRTANKDGEPIRYARPARPENSISSVVYETRFESPVKVLFRSKPKGKGKTGNGSVKKTSTKQGFGFMKSSPSLRRLFFSSSEGEDSDSDGGFWSRRSSLSSEATGATSVRSSISGEPENTPVPDASGTFTAAPGCNNA